MKNLFRISFAGVLFMTSMSAAALTAIEPEDWFENQTVFAVNKERAHATYVPYSSLTALKADAAFYAHPWVQSKSDLRQSLNGTWKFHFNEKPSERPMDFFKSDFDSSDWDNIPVPSCWEMQGYDTPMYVNVDHPYDKSQCPKIVKRGDNNGEYAENPVGSYLTEFNVPESWNGMELFLNFEGIYSAAYIWVNGKFVGYTQAANTNHEFDVTSFCHTGKNSLAVQVIKWSDGSYLEGQDMFRWGGIYRDVTLTAVPKTFIRDHYITWTSGKDKNYTSGTLKVDVDVENRSSEAANVIVELQLVDADGKVVAELPSQTVSHLVSNGSSSVSSSVELSNINLWSCENPYFEYLIVRLKDFSGDETMAFATKYGFRTIEQTGLFV
ncbi:MAG: beta galactosidase jelly roll domain-containing protein, partial [Muribaculaceae bacterium]|nr:beta galactosidase jelly roll domain-containing protein [Muribaculaceae bacterium]